jgi:hypothetical protein
VGAVPFLTERWGAIERMADPGGCKEAVQILAVSMAASGA